MRTALFGLLTALVAVVSPASALSAASAGQDDLRREGKDRTQKDALEGKPAPTLQVEAWMNAPAGGLNLADLRGQVVVLDFWGVW